MDVHYNSMRCGSVRWILLLGATFSAGLSANIAIAAESTSAQNLRLTGAAALRADQPAQKSGSLSLRAYLTGNGSIAALPPVQENAGFALIAKLVAKPSVCYNDTIFRNDFDGDGF